LRGLGPRTQQEAVHRPEATWIVISTTVEDQKITGGKTYAELDPAGVPLHLWRWSASRFARLHPSPPAAAPASGGEAA
jgi:hypothetical protein